MLRNAISFEKLWVLFARTVWTGDFVLQDEMVNFPFAKNTPNDFFSFPLVLHKLLSAISEIIICMARFSPRLSHDTQRGTKIPIVLESARTRLGTRREL